MASPLPSPNGHPAPRPSSWAEVTAETVCPVCGADAGCRLKSDRVACRNRTGPLAESRIGGVSGILHYVHPRDPQDGSPYQPVPEDVTRFLAALFEPGDVVLVRPIETWTEDGRKRSRVVYPAMTYPIAGTLGTDFRAWARLLRTATTEKANLFFGVCPRVGPKQFDLTWQIRMIRVLWADLDHCSVEEAVRRREATGLPAPTVTVRSGYGVHLYWRLADPVVVPGPVPPAVHKEFVDQGPGKKKAVRPYVVDPVTGARVYDLPALLDPIAALTQVVLAGIAGAVGGDHTQDLARMLRLPATLNRKGERNGTPPVPCELVGCEPDRRFPFAEFERFAKPEAKGPVTPAVAAVRLPAGRKLTPTRRNRLVDLLNVCAVSGVGDRSESDFAVCAWAIEHGLDPDAVWAEAQAVGKFAERGRAYFDRTWQKAADKVRGAVYARACRRAGVGPACNERSGPHDPGDPAAPSSGAGETAPDLPPAFEEPDDPHLLARIFRRTHAVPAGDTWRFYRDESWGWDGRRWKAAPDAEMRCRVAEFCKHTLDAENRRAGAVGGEKPSAVPKVTRELVANVLQALGGMVMLSRDVPQPCWLADDRPPGARSYLALGNGLLDVEAFLGNAAEVLHPHSPRWFSPVCLPYSFDPDADCPTWRAVLARNLGDDPGKARLLQQWAGYLLLPDTGQQRFLMMTGEGANGKSVVCAVLRGLLGADNVASVGLELFGDKFHLAETLGKLANIVPEVGELDRIAEGQLKAFVAGDAMLFERKYKQPFTARPTARLVLATNNPPHFSDKSDGIWRRVDLLRFVIQIPPQDRVPGMDTVEFWEREGELPGILNWALAGLADLRAAGRFVVPGGCATDLRQLRLDSNPTRRFLTERYTPGAGEQPSAEVYRAYVEWCQSTGHRAVSDTTFGKEVARAFPSSQRKRKGPREGRFWAYTGLDPLADEGD